MDENVGLGPVHEGNAPGGHHADHVSRGLPCKAQQCMRTCAFDVILQQMLFLIAQVVEGQPCKLDTA